MALSVLLLIAHQRDVVIDELICKLAKVALDRCWLEIEVAGHLAAATV